MGKQEADMCYFINHGGIIFGCCQCGTRRCWLRRFLHHLGVKTTSLRHVTIFCDNQAAIAYIKDPKYHSKIKHIDIKFNFIRDIVQQNEVNLKYISTHQMVADPLTKPIVRDVYNSHVRVMRLNS